MSFKIKGIFHPKINSQSLQSSEVHSCVGCHGRTFELLFTIFNELYVCVLINVFTHEKKA